MATATKKKHGPSPTTVGLFAAGAAAVWWIGAKRRRKTSTGTSLTLPPPPEAPVDVEFGEAQFPPAKAPVQWERLQTLAALAEERTGMRGLRTYLLATAKAESGGRPSAMNTKTDGPPAFRLFCKSMNYGGRFLHNPWRPKICDSSDPLSARWSYSGGWFQMMTSTALATADKRGHKHDPARVFDPPFAVAYAADLVRRLRVGYGAKTWGDIRAGWALPKWAKPSNTSEGKAKVIARFQKRLNEVASSMGGDANLAGKAFTSANYPGFTAVLHALLAAEGRLPSA